VNRDTFDLLEESVSRLLCDMLTTKQVNSPKVSVGVGSR
jgi:hypothetical protein